MLNQTSSKELPRNYIISPKRSLHRIHRASNKLRKSKFSSISGAFDNQIEKILKEIKENKGDADKNKLIFTESSFYIIKYILNKINRSELELTLIVNYLKTLDNFIKILKNSELNLETLLLKISVDIKCEKISNNSIIVRFGEKGSKFFILLKGRVGVLLIKENKLKLTYYEYILHLCRLYLFNEIELFYKTIAKNHLIYNINELEIENFIKNYLNNKANGKTHIYKFNILDEMDVKHLCYFIDSFSETVKEYNKGKKNITKEEYMNLTFPWKDLRINDINYKEPYLIIYSYFEVINLFSGDFFGEIALQNDNLKRTATIISKEDCVFGTLTSDAYNMNIKSIQTKIRRNNIRFLLSFNVFKDLSWNIFANNFFNFFKLRRFNHNDIIIKQGSPINDIFFVKEGEFEVYANMSNLEIEEYLLNLRSNNYKKYSNVIENYKKIIPKEDYIQRKFKISILTAQDIIGLNDMIFIDNKSIVTIKCSSNESTVFCIEKAVFENISNKIKEVKINLIELTNLRKKCMINRLRLLKNSDKMKHLKYDDDDSEYIKLNILYSKNNPENYEKKRIFSAKVFGNKYKNILKDNPIYNNNFELFDEDNNNNIRKFEGNNFRSKKKIKSRNTRPPSAIKSLTKNLSINSFYNTETIFSSNNSINFSNEMIKNSYRMNSKLMNKMNLDHKNKNITNLKLHLKNKTLNIQKENNSKEHLMKTILNTTNKNIKYLLKRKNDSNNKNKNIVNKNKKDINIYSTFSERKYDRNLIKKNNKYSSNYCLPKKIPINFMDKLVLYKRVNANSDLY